MDEHTNEPTESEIEEAEKALNDANTQEPSLRRKPKLHTAKERKRLGTSIASALSEFIDCYIILGFDVNGNGMLLINSANDMESRALTNLVDEFIDSGVIPTSPSPRKDEGDEDDDED